ncbi:DUF4417 domain-containing protein [Limosilactobacillus sp. STM2_1]|uniref:DUF4417 domain-containing protein n=1 Tax=Limosilactobacillus rudii TaxID=2759755 RepID=A0A7W3UKT8_9LACO|nr:DUF4417 domain-containing protein [Limosilactobacillus rudii]MBB1080231.1 DUF4417 domain-containing protein [Limosilactobacillus rudii]MBB1096865.1 DUF4417 domain-containing protein [Limosilactobacillus rudii]MCD7133763.1 DUF4417 domain-containing protein [Limosilactobacillus rudii]
MGSQRTISKYNLEYYVPDMVAGKYDMPTIYPTFYKPEKLVGFNQLNVANHSAGVHFYLDDYQFERVWKRPAYYIDKLKQFDCVLTPDFSLYRDMPLSMMIWNIYRSRLLGQLMQRQGLTVIPTVSWADKRSFDFCFDGLPSRSTLSISTIGVKKSNEANRMWQRGVLEMIRRLHPKQLLVYGGEVDFIFPEDIEIVYYKNNNIERLRGL